TLGAQCFGFLLALEGLIGRGGMGQDRQGALFLDRVRFREAICRGAPAGFSRGPHGVYNFPALLPLREARGDFAPLYLLPILDRHVSHSCDELGGDYGGLADDKAFPPHVDVAAGKGTAEVDRKRDQRSKIDQPCQRASHDSPRGFYDSFQRWWAGM